MGCKKNICSNLMEKSTVFSAWCNEWAKWNPQHLNYSLLNSFLEKKFEEKNTYYDTAKMFLNTDW